MFAGAVYPLFVILLKILAERHARLVFLIIEDFVERGLVLVQILQLQVPIHQFFIESNPSVDVLHLCNLGAKCLKFTLILLGGLDAYETLVVDVFLD